MESTWMTLRAIFTLATLATILAAACFWQDLPVLLAQFQGYLRERGLSPTAARGLAAAVPDVPEPAKAGPLAPDVGELAGGGALPSFEMENGDVGPRAETSTSAPSAAGGSEQAADQAEPGRSDERMPRRSPFVSAVIDEPPPDRSDFAAAEAAPPTARLRAAEERLRTLGADHYRLEGWGPTDELYRFECQMAIPGRRGAARHFEATEKDALAAVERVLAEVEDWHRSAAR